jgi:hypothetical protein
MEHATCQSLVDGACRIRRFRPFEEAVRRICRLSEVRNIAEEAGGTSNSRTCHPVCCVLSLPVVVCYGKRPGLPCRSGRFLFNPLLQHPAGG